MVLFAEPYYVLANRDVVTSIAQSFVQSSPEHTQTKRVIVSICEIVFLILSCPVRLFLYCADELFMHSFKGHFGVLFCCIATLDINTKVTVCWVHKQFRTTLFSILLDCDVVQEIDPQRKQGLSYGKYL